MKKKRPFQELKALERKARQNIIVDAAERVIISRPFDQVNMRDIAREAGVSPASIYRYFPYQHTLYMETFFRCVKDMVSLFSDLAEEQESKAIEHIAENFIDYFFDNTHYFKMMGHFILGTDIDNNTKKRLEEGLRSVFEQFDIIFRSINVKGDVRLLSKSFFYSLYGILLTAGDLSGVAGERSRRQMKEMAHIIATMFKNSASTLTQ